jgi:drug/metabolite transporter, DME family
MTADRRGTFRSALLSRTACGSMAGHMRSLATDKESVSGGHQPGAPSGRAASAAESGIERSPAERGTREASLDAGAGRDSLAALAAGATRRDSLAALAVLAAAVLWGTAGTAQALAETQASPAAVGAGRLLIGGSVLALLAGVSPTGRAGVRACFSRTAILWTLSAAIALALYQVAFFSSVARTGVTLGTMVTLGAAPILTAVFSRLWLGERLSRRWAMGTLAAVAGCVLVLIPGKQLSVEPLGFGLALVAAACYGVYTVFAKRMLEHQGHSPLALIASTAGIAAVLLAPIAIREVPELFQPRSAISVLWVGLAVTALAYSLFVRGLRRVTAATAGTLGLAEPLVAAMLGLLVLGDRLSPAVSVGAVLLFAGLVVVATARRSSSGSS